MAFDIAGARAAGYSDDEIAGFLGEQNKFDTAGALGAGYSAQEIISRFSGTNAIPAAKPSTERTWTEVAKDSLNSVTQGAVDVVGTLPGVVYGAATGNYDNAWLKGAQGINAVLEDDKSKGMQQRRKDLSEKLLNAEGWRQKFAAGAVETLTDPALLADTLLRSAPGMVAGGVVGRLAGAGADALGMTALQTAKATAGQAASQGLNVVSAAPRVAGATALGTAASIQGSSVASATYEDAMKIPVGVYRTQPGFKEKVSELQKTMPLAAAEETAKSEMASSAATRAGVVGAAASLASMKYLPGGSTIEKALLPAALRTPATTAVTGALSKPLTAGMAGGAASKVAELAVQGTNVGLKEGFSESVEEGAGAIAQSLEASRISGEAPDLRSIAADAAGPAFAAGLAMGAPIGARDTRNAPKVEDQPTVPTAPVVPPGARTAAQQVLDAEAAQETPATPAPAPVATPAPAAGVAQPAAPAVPPAAPTNLAPSVPLAFDPVQQTLAALDAKLAETKQAAPEADVLPSTVKYPDKQVIADVEAQAAAAKQAAAEAETAKAKAKAADKNADLANATVYSDVVLRSIATNPNAGPVLLAAVKAEQDRRSTAATAAQAAVDEHRTQALSGESADIGRNLPEAKPLSVEHGITLLREGLGKPGTEANRAYLSQLKAEIGDTSFDLITRHAQQPLRVAMLERKTTLPALIEGNNRAIAQWNWDAKGTAPAAEVTPAVPPAPVKAKAAPVVSMSRSTTLSPQALALQQRMAQNPGYGKTTTRTASTGVAGTPSANPATDVAGSAPVLQQKGSGASGVPTGAPAFSNQPTAGGFQLADPVPDTVIELQRGPVRKAKGVEFKVSSKPLTEEQQLVSAMARKMGKNLSWIEHASGDPQEMPDGFVTAYGGKYILMDVNSSKPLLEILLHEGTHALPKHIRAKLLDFVLPLVSAAGKTEFLRKYDYAKADPRVQNEEVLAYVGQQIARKPEFIQDLKTALGNKDFAEFAKVLIAKMKDWLGKGDSQFDSEFLGKHVTDVQGIHDKLVEAYAQSMREQGLEPDAEVGGIAFAKNADATGDGVIDSFTPSKSSKADVKAAGAYADAEGILPYTSKGQLEVPIAFALKQQYGEKDLAKGRENHPLLGLPMNKDGTVTLYYPATNEVARQLAKDKVLRGATPQATRIYLTNESSGPKVMNSPGQMDQALGGANVMLMVDPSYVHVANEYEDGRKDFFIPIAEGKAFAEKMKMVKLFTVDGPRTKALSQSVTMNDIVTGFTKGIESYQALDTKAKTARHKAAKAALMAEHNVGTLLGENGKLQKTRVGDYGLRDEATDKSVASMGLGLASAQKINDKLSTCPQSARCETLCLGDTSGQNLLYGGDGQFRSGPRMSQYLKTEALVLSPENFSIVLAREIESFVKWADSEKGFESLTDADGNKVQTPKQSYKPAIRLNVTSDFPPKVFEALIKMFPQVEFYDYTKLNSDSIADNHHLTYSSTGVLQRVEGKVLGKGDGLSSGKGGVKSNWDAMVKKMERGFNVAMAFTSRNDIPKFLKDERTGQTFEVWDGDNYDARFLDPARYAADGKRVGMIVGLTNKDRTGKPEDAATKYDGFFVDYDQERDGDTLLIQDQEALAAGRKVIPIAQAEPEVVFANKQNLDADITIEIPLDDGKTAKLTVNAATYIKQLDAREDALRMVKECMA